MIEEAVKRVRQTFKNFHKATEEDSKFFKNGKIGIGGSKNIQEIAQLNFSLVSHEKLHNE